MDEQEYQLLCEQLIEINPLKKGGVPVIRGTRMPIRSLATLVDKCDLDELKEDYSYLPDSAYQFAVEWAARNQL